MPVLPALLDALRGGSVEAIDLTAPLSETTPILQLPEPFANTSGFRLEELSRYDDRGPAWYWNDIHTGEHTGTHLDAPNHWVTGREGPDVSQVPTTTMVAPVAVIDMTAEVDADPDFLLEVAHLEKWQAEHGPLPDGGWLLYGTGWSSRGATQEEFMNADDARPHTPGVSPECARCRGQESRVTGLGVTPAGPDPGAPGGFAPPFSCHHSLMGA